MVSATINIANGKRAEGLCWRFCHGIIFAISSAWSVQAAGQEIVHDAGADLSQNPPTTLDAIQVTAQFRAQNVQETPLAISAINAEMMQARSQSSVLDIASTIPNVMIKPMSDTFGNGAAISIRGVGQYDGSFALEPGVGVYIDDVYHPTLIGSVFDLLDLERIEILRGPQGTLTGKNSIGGAVKLYSHLPDDDVSGMLEVTSGSFNRRDLRVTGNFILADNILFLRLSGVSRKRDGYLARLDYGCLYPESGIQRISARGDCSLGSEGGEHYQGLRAALRWIPSNTFEMHLIGDLSDLDNEPPASEHLAGVDARFIPDQRYVDYSTYSGNGWDLVPRSRVESRGVSLKLAWQTGSQHTLTSLSAYREYEGGWGEDVDGSPLAWHTMQWQVWNHTFSQELRFNGSMFGERLDYTLGSYFFTSSSNLEGIVDIPFLFAFQDDPVTSSSKSVFVHTSYDMTERWNLSAGARFTDESKRYTFTRLDPVTRMRLNDIDGQTGYYHGNRVDWRLAASWQPTSGGMLYTSLATGFKGGGINPRPFVPEQVVPFQPEILTAWEVGFKTELFDHRLRINTAVFLHKYDDILITITNGYAGFPVSAVPVNAGEADVRGAEIELTAWPIEGLLIDASYGWLDFEYTRLSPDALASQMEYWMVMPYLSGHKASLGIQYTMRSSSGNLLPRLDANWHSDFFSTATNSEESRVKGQIIANARISWQPNMTNWEFSAGVTNLFDSYYHHNKLDVVNFSGIITANPGRPREWFFSIKYLF